MYKIDKPRQFQPVIIYNDHQLFDIPIEQKEKVHDMLKLNGQLWTSLSSNPSSPLSSPTLSSTSSTSSSSTIYLPSISYPSSTNTTTPPSSPEYSYHEDEEDEEVFSFHSKRKSTFKKSSSKNKKIRKELDTNKKKNKKSIKKNNKTHPTPSSPITDHGLEEELEEQQKKKRGNLPKAIIFILKQWLINHSDHPYPSDEEKAFLQKETNLTINQISNWFINARRRLLPYLINDNNVTTISKKKKIQDVKHIQKKSTSALKRPKRSCNNNK
ncbi:unnamed protein product [Cunninghamella blakesleeana]